MIYPIVDPITWSMRYKIEMNPLPCPKCGLILLLEIPIAFDGYRGLKAAPCSRCGLKEVPFVVVPVGNKELQFWKKFC